MAKKKNKKKKTAPKDQPDIPGLHFKEPERAKSRGEAPNGANSREEAPTERGAEGPKYPAKAPTGEKPMSPEYFPPLSWTGAEGPKYPAKAPTGEKPMSPEYFPPLSWTGAEGPKYPAKAPTGEKPMSPDYFPPLSWTGDKGQQSPVKAQTGEKPLSPEYFPPLSGTGAEGPKYAEISQPREKPMSPEYFSPSSWIGAEGPKYPAQAQTGEKMMSPEYFPHSSWTGAEGPNYPKISQPREKPMSPEYFPPSSWIGGPKYPAQAQTGEKLMSPEYFPHSSWAGAEGPKYPAQAQTGEKLMSPEYFPHSSWTGGPKYPAEGPKYPADGPKYPAEGPNYPAEGPNYPAESPKYPAKAQTGLDELTQKLEQSKLFTQTGDPARSQGNKSEEDAEIPKGIKPMSGMTGEVLRSYKIPSVKAQQDRPRGKEGTLVDILVNHLKMKVDLNKVYKFDISIKSPWKRENRKSDAPLFIKAFDEFIKAHKGEYFGITDDEPTYWIVYDGQKIAFSTKKPLFDILEKTVAIKEDQYCKNPINLNIKISKVAHVDIKDAIYRYGIAGDTEMFQNEGVTPAITVINTVMQYRQKANPERIVIGGSAFSPAFLPPAVLPSDRQEPQPQPQPPSQPQPHPEDVLEFGGGKSLWTGLFSSFRPAWQPFLNVDMANKPGYDESSVIDFLKKCLQVSVRDRGGDGSSERGWGRGGTPERGRGGSSSERGWGRGGTPERGRGGSSSERGWGRGGTPERGRGGSSSERGWGRGGTPERGRGGSSSERGWGRGGTPERGRGGSSSERGWGRGGTPERGRGGSSSERGWGRGGTPERGRGRGGYHGDRFGVEQPVDLASLSEENTEVLNHSIKGLKIRYLMPDGQKRDGRATKLGPNSDAQNVTLKIDSVEETMSVRQYYKRKYNYTIQHPTYPTLQIGNPNKKYFIPLELCRIKAQACPSSKRLTEDETSQMIKKTAMKPKDRMDKVLKMVEAENFNNDKHVKAFGLSISDKFLGVKARLLAGPVLRYNDDKNTIKVSNGRWKMEAKHVFAVSKKLATWAILDLANIEDGRAKDFLSLLIAEGEKCGFHMEHPKHFVARERGESAEKCFEKIMKVKNLQLVMVFVPCKGGKDYGRIKYLGDTHYTLPTQFVLKKNIYGKPRVGKPDSSTLHNICLKLNSKLGGTNQILKPEFNKFATLKNVMFLGADVTHPSPDQKGIKPSIAAIVGSMDESISQYGCRVKISEEEQDTEVILDAISMIYDLLKQYEKINHRKPEKLIFYRDGVSEGQFVDVMNKEVSAIKGACKLLKDNYEPPVTFIVAQKRHKTRIFPKVDKDAGNKENVKPGTVIDTDITSPTEQSFFLASHEGIQGTTRPTCYHVLFDENAINPDDLQKMTFHLCHLYARCERSVSYPAPTYYAHLAAFRAREHHNVLIEKKLGGNREAREQIENISLKDYFI